MNVAYFGYEEWVKTYMETRAPDGVLFTFFDHPLDAEHIPDNTDFEAISVFVDSAVPREVIEQFPNLKYIATRSTGFDHIDIDACKERGIAVSNVPTYGENTVAEFAFALILELSRKVSKGYGRLRESGTFSPNGLQGFDLQGKTIGVIGVGNIGKQAVRIARGFGMRAVAHDVAPDESFAEETDCTYMALEQLLAESDVVTIHVPHLDATHHLLNATRFSQMKDGAYIINTARGAIIETNALLDALQSGKIAGAGLDVLEEESTMQEELDYFTDEVLSKDTMQTLIANNKLIDMDNVIVTPHCAFNTKEAVERILDTTIENINGFVDASPKHTVA